MKIGIMGGFAPSLLNFRGPLLAELIGRGHTVCAIAPSIEVELANQLRTLGAEPITIDLDRTGANPLHDLRAEWMLAKRFDSLALDAMLAYTIKPIALGIPAASRVGIPRRTAMFTGLGTMFRGKGLKSSVIGPVARRMVRRATRKATGVVFQNSDDLGMIRGLGWLNHKQAILKTMGTGVDLEFFAPQPPHTADVALMVTRLVRDKGVREFVSAAQQVRARRPDAIFQLAGPLESSNHPDAIRRSELDGWIAEGHIEYLGNLDDVRPALARCRVFVLPSYGEGRPRTVQEALASGRPVVTTDSVGCHDALGPDPEPALGAIVPTCDPTKLAKAIDRIFDLSEPNPDIPRRWAEAHYDAKAIARTVADHIDGTSTTDEE